MLIIVCRTGRDRKPKEVVGVYDPIPRFPTASTGEVLENREKIKKISMNVDRIRYWLSVGAQPSDHCARLFAKVSTSEKSKVTVTGQFNATETTQ